MVAFGYLKVQVGLPVLQLLQLQRLDVEVGPLDPVLEKARSPTIFSVSFLSIQGHALRMKTARWRGSATWSAYINSSDVIVLSNSDIFLRSEWGGVKKGAKTAAMPAPFSVICFAISRM